MIKEVGFFKSHELYDGILGVRPDGTRVGVATDGQGTVKIDTGYSDTTYNLEEVVALGNGDYKFDSGIEAIMRAIHEAPREALLPGTVRQLQPEIAAALDEVR